MADRTHTLLGSINRSGRASIVPSRYAKTVTYMPTSHSEQYCVHKSTRCRRASQALNSSSKGLVYRCPPTGRECSTVPRVIYFFHDGKRSPALSAMTSFKLSCSTGKNNNGPTMNSGPMLYVDGPSYSYQMDKKCGQFGSNLAFL